MSNYERNTSMIVCILGVLIIGTIAIGAISYFGTNTWFPGPTDLTPVNFHYDRAVGGVTGLVTLDVDIGTGSVSIHFVENDTLLYKVDYTMSNSSYLQYGEPTVSYSSNTITVSHEVGSANITLGTGVNYKLVASTTTGSISCFVSNNATVGAIDLTASTGSISFTMLGDAFLRNSPDFNFVTGTGSIIVVVILPHGVGGEFEASTGTGTVSVTAPTWNKVTNTHYRTDDYATAEQSVLMIAQTGTGSVTAILT
jgi:hypothetical protein